MFTEPHGILTAKYASFQPYCFNLSPAIASLQHLLSEGENLCDQREELVAALQSEQWSLTDKNEQLTTEISFLKAELEALI